ncbi:MAG TPA: NAD-dependent epimerase/dehydratase family protein [Candidatus Lokiarchaeia archaeon]|nr:NAD-dependent epimerase/dehydratase family protein [Candidatus Lokiarchaeia archaeon]
MKAIVTGANGFVGSHLCKYLLGQGVDVHALVRKTSDLFLLKDLVPDLKGITLEYGDITSIDSLKEAFANKDVIFNAAGIIKGTKQETYDRVNVDGFKNVCDAVLEVNPNVETVIMFSSQAAAGPSKLGQIMTEDDEPVPMERDMYGISKLRMEQAIKPYMDKLPISIVRPPSVFGPGDVVTFDLFNAAKVGLKAVIGKRKMPYSIVDVTDLCEGVYLMATTPDAIGNVFYFTTGEPTDWNALPDLIGETCFGKKKPLRTLWLTTRSALLVAGLLEFFAKFTRKTPFLNKSKMIEGSATGWAVSSDKAKKLLGWQPRHTIESSMQEAATWFKEHGWL